MANPTPLAPTFKAENIPAVLKAQPRWAPWRAVWNDKRKKFDKVPYDPLAPAYGISTAKPERWATFDVALEAMHQGQFDGLGYVVTGDTSITMLDLDNCVQGGALSPLAAELVATLNSYVELSPSTKGLRLVIAGHVVADWTNHDQGIEVYSGNQPRFVTITGDALGTPRAVRAAPEGYMAELATRFAREREPATVTSMTMPDLVDALAMPDLADLGLPPKVRDFLEDGTTSSDRSRDLFGAAVSLYRAGLNDAEVFTTLVSNPVAFEVALDHRRQDSDRATRYLWVEHCLKAKARAAHSSMATADDFEDVSTPGDNAPSGTPPAPKDDGAMFDIVPAWQFVTRKPMTWLLKGLLPQADLGAVFGPSGAGKSFLVLDLVTAIARGVEWRGHRCRQAGVLYVAAEGAQGVMQRLQAHSSHHGYDMRDVPLAVLGAAPNILEKAHVKGLVDSIKIRCGSNTRLIVVDTLAQVTPGANENSGEDMGRALGHCKAIAQATGAMVLLVAHAGKDTERGLRGWSGIKAALDVEIQVEKEGTYHAATITKMKDGSSEGSTYPFTLQSVGLGEDEDGDAITSAIVAVADEASGKAPPKGLVQQTLLRVLEDLTDLAGPPTRDALIDATAAHVAPDKGKRDTRKQRTERALESLILSRRVEINAGEVILCA